MSINNRFLPLLKQRRDNSLIRQRPLVTSAQSAVMQINGQQVINFSSNDYLGLANHPALKQTATETESLSYGSGAAHLVTGHHLEHHLLEDELADWLGAERVLLFSTGYMANLAVLQTLAQKGDVVLADKLNHASLIDGALHSQAELKRYPHLDMQALEKRLQTAQQKQQQAIITTDTVFSMDGDLAPLDKIQALAKQYNAWTYFDDAHGVGVFGTQGRGCLNHFKQTLTENTIVMGTLGKAFGCSGAFVAGSETVIESLINFARPYIYTTAMSPINAKVCRTALKLVKNANKERQKLQENIQQFQQGTKKIGLIPHQKNWGQTRLVQSAIQVILLADSQTALAWSEALKQQGIWATAIRPPTVPKNTARLRITLSAAHSSEQINKLLNVLNKQI
ncbi:MAG TPA: 8-amino-7-oxononanoate synthase [Thiomicrospira sp.]|nr:8-amino-7-oxononanoate synthase [Thiomicrospira sp.]